MSHEQLAQKGMLTWLYDGDRWPSGFGGGLVTSHHPSYDGLSYKVRKPLCSQGQIILP